MRRLGLIGLSVLAIGFGAALRLPPTGHARAILARAAGVGVWPSPADYTTIKTAAAVRDHVLFHVSDWRKKAFGANLALNTLYTVRIKPGKCAIFVGELIGNLKDLADAYPGENWAPLKRTVRQEPSVARACRRPQERWKIL
jgi:hypothetical protein